MAKRSAVRAEHLIASSPWTKATPTSDPVRVVIRMLDDTEYMVQTHTKHGTKHRYNTGYRVQFSQADGSRKEALTLAFVVFQSSAAFRVLHSTWVEAPVID